MNNKTLKKKASKIKGTKKTKQSTFNDDPFFTHESKRRRRRPQSDDEIDSDDSDDDFFEENGAAADEVRKDGDEAEEEEETVGEKRKRLATAYLESVKEIARREEEDADSDWEERDGGKDGERDSMVARILQREQLEESGRLRRLIASRIQEPEATDEFRTLVKHRQSVTAVALSDDDSRGFSASKEGTIVHWDVDSGKHEKYRWPTMEVLKSHGANDPQGKATKHSNHVLALAASSDGRYLASGGLDRHVHLWDTRTREHIQAFPGHKEPVSCLAFGKMSSELFSGSFDKSIKMWNVEDRAYISTLCGHGAEVLAIDCLRKERLLTVGRDRMMCMWKVSEEKHLKFLAPASLESCCFISSEEYLSGAVDGRVELWTTKKKKPVYTVKNAHALGALQKKFEQRDNGGLSNGHIENSVENVGNSCSTVESWVGSVAVCRNSDLAASGAGNGFVRLWSIESEPKSLLKPLFDLPMAGFVNSLAFAKSGQFLIAGVGQEPRLGRWGRLSSATNGVAVHPLKLSRQ